MKTILIILALLLTGCNGTAEYRAYLDTYNTSSRFYCKDGKLVNEYIKPDDTVISYRIPVINNKFVECNITDGYILIPELGIRVENKE